MLELPLGFCCCCYGCSKGCIRVRSGSLLCRKRCLGSFEFCYFAGLSDEMDQEISEVIIWIQSEASCLISSRKNSMAAENSGFDTVHNNENIQAWTLSDDQLQTRIDRYLSILDQRQQRQQRHQTEHISRRKMVASVQKILTQCHRLVQNGDVTGFVCGLVTKERTWSASSNNLRGWWKDQALSFDKIDGQLQETSGTRILPLHALNNLHANALAPILSALMQHCNPPQSLHNRFDRGVPVQWWPKGTEDWYQQLKVPQELTPPPYRKPHQLRKPCKVAVLAAMIKNMEPDYQKMRNLVAPLRHKINQRDYEIWSAVIASEELALKKQLEMSGNDHDSGGENVPGVIGGTSVQIKGESSSRTSELQRSLSTEQDIYMLVPRRERSELALAAGKIEMRASDEENRGANKKIAISESEWEPETTPVFAKGQISASTVTFQYPSNYDTLQPTMPATMPTAALPVPYNEAGASFGSTEGIPISMNVEEGFLNTGEESNFMQPINQVSQSTDAGAANDRVMYNSLQVQEDDDMNFELPSTTFEDFDVDGYFNTPPDQDGGSGL